MNEYDHKITISLDLMVQFTQFMCGTRRGIFKKTIPVMYI